MTTTTGDPVAYAAVVIPPQLRTDEFRFIVLPAGSKGGGNEKDWQRTRNYAWNDPRLADHLARGGNYGVFPAAGSGISILDADDHAGCVGARLLDGIEDRTFTVETGGSKSERRKFHFFFRLNPPFAGKFPLFSEGEHIGELYCQHPDSAKGYVVGPNSLHPSGERYLVALDRPIADVDRIDYAMRLSRLAPKKADEVTVAKTVAASSNGLLADRLGLRVSDFLMPDKANYRGQEVEGAHPVHGSDTGSNLTIGPDVWYCRRHGTGGGALEAFAVAEGILDCGDVRPGCLRPVWGQLMDRLRAKGYEVDPPTPPFPTAGALGGGEVSAIVEEPEPAPDAPPEKKRKVKELPPFCYRHPKYGISLDVGAVSDHLYETFSVVSFNGTLYVYGDGVYTENKGQIQAEIKTILAAAGTNEQLTRITREVLAHLLATSPWQTYPFDQAPDRIPVANGVVVIDYEAGEVTLDAHSPGYRFTYKLPVVYDKDAEGATFQENVIDTYLDEEAVPALYQIPATALLQAHGTKPYKRAYILHGDANGGKSTYLEILSALFGGLNIGGASLQQIGTDRFVNGMLEGKVLNMCDDLEDVPLKNVGPFKTLTGIFTHTIERKHQNPYQGRITAVHVFTCNAPPEVPERFVYDDAFWVRWCYLHFDNVFPVDPEFNARWITPENLSGFFNDVLTAMIVIRRRGLMIAPDASETKQAWTVAADPFAQFVAAEMRPAEKEQLFQKEALLKTFIRWCEDHNIPSRKVPTTINALTRLTFKNDWRTVRGPGKSRDYQYGARKQWNSGSEYAPTKEDEGAGADRTFGEFG